MVKSTSVLTKTLLSIALAISTKMAFCASPLETLYKKLITIYDISSNANYQTRPPEQNFDYGSLRAIFVEADDSDHTLIEALQKFRGHLDGEQMKHGFCQCIFNRLPSDINNGQTVLGTVFSTLKIMQERQTNIHEQMLSQFLTPSALRFESVDVT